MTIYRPARLSFASRASEFVFIECTPTGFQTVVMKPVPSANDLMSYRWVVLSGKHLRLAKAFEAYERFMVRETPTSIEYGDVPADARFEGCIELNDTEANDLDDQVGKAVSVGAVNDPRKVRAAEAAVRQAEAELRGLNDGLASILADPNATWIEDRLQNVSVEKSGADIRVSGYLGSASELQESFKRKIAYELGGTFHISGFVDADGVYVVHRNENSDVEKRLTRARPTVIRRPRRYETVEERIGAMRDLLDGVNDRLLRVQSQAAEAYLYSNILIDRMKMQSIFDQLPAATQELFRPHAPHAL